MANNGRGKTIGTMLDDLVPRLEKTSDTPGLDAQVLLAHVLGKPRAWVLAHPEIPLTQNRAARLEALLACLESGQPLPYVLGHWEFFGLDFEVTPQVLIPRPETELLVERAVDWLKARPGQRQAVDVGTGSGCIAISLAVNLPDLRITATDVSPQAVEVARHNAERLHVADRVKFLEVDLFPDPLLPESFDLIVANLPYIPTHTLHTLPVYQHEPALALDGGADGLVLVRKLITQAPNLLAPGGLLLMEIESSQGPAALSIAYDAFSEAEIHLHKDLAGRDRLLEVQLGP